MQQLVMSRRTRGVDDLLKFFNVTKRYVGDGSKCTKVWCHIWCIHTHKSLPSSVQKDELVYLTVFICGTQIYIPINDSNTHWYLVVVDIRAKEIQYLDTMSSSLHFADRKKQIAYVVSPLKCQFILSMMGSVEDNWLELIISFFYVG